MIRSAGRCQPADVKPIISFLMWICNRRYLQHPNPTAMGTGERRDESDREFGLESIVALAAAIYSVNREAISRNENIQRHCSRCREDALC